VFLITVGSIDIATIWAEFWTILLAVVRLLTLKGCCDGTQLHNGRGGTATEANISLASHPRPP
jgi:hypothetical protein